MGRSSFVAILALVLCGAAGVGCTNSPDDFGLEGSSSGGSKSGSRKRTPNAASGEISGDPETPNDETLAGGETDEPAANDPGNAEPQDPPPANDPAPTPPPPNPDPTPAPDPVPTGSFAVGTQLVTTANLNIRQGADTSFAIITTAPKGSTVTVATVSGANGWVNVSWNGNVGWSSKNYLTAP